jgi:transcriptional regulator with XRE-family HTH domain
MVIGDRIRALREQRGFSQGQIEKRTGLLRCYISRVENGHTVPSIDTVEKLARALDVPLYQIFWDGEEMPALANLTGRMTEHEVATDGSPEHAQFIRRMAQLFYLLSEEDRQLLLTAAQRMAARW